jgi:pimeloyl-ACP methyl ester carboxylesterase
MSKLRTLLTALLAITLPWLAAEATAASSATTIVLVHGAFADGSSWNKVIPILEKKGLAVISVQNPLTSLADDVAATKRAIANAPGPVVLVGHSWGGTVITEAGSDPKVKALVYVAAGANDAGGSFNDLGRNYPAPAGASEIRVDGSGFASLTATGIRKFFAHDVPAGEARVMAATQGPIRASAFDEKVSVAAWSMKPSWYIVAAQDHMIQPDLERALAAKMKAKTTILNTSHVAMISAPKQVAAVIESAATSLAPRVGARALDNPG